MSQPSKIYAYPVAEGLFIEEEFHESNRYFTHPGIFTTDQTIRTVREHLASGRKPWVASLTHWETWAKDALAQKPEPVQRIFRRTPNHIGTEESIRDFTAAQHLAYLFCLTDKPEYADKAIEIMNVWARTLKAIRGAGFNLQSGLILPQLMGAAELIKHRSDRWKQEDQDRFQAFCEVVLLPHVINLRISINGNHDCATNMGLAALAIYLDDEFLFNRSLNYHLHSKGYGAVNHYFLANGECQEDGRDMGHSLMGARFFGRIAEMARNQGENIYDRYDYRIAAAMEHYARVQMDYYIPAMYSSVHPSPLGTRGMVDLSELQAYRYFTCERSMPMPFTTQLIHIMQRSEPKFSEQNQLFLPNEIALAEVNAVPRISKETFRFGVVPFDGGKLDNETYAQLSESLAQQTGKAVQIVDGQGYDALLQGVSDGDLDAALVPPDEYVAKQETLGLSLAASERMPDGRNGFHHIWLVPKAAGVTNLKEAFDSDVIMAAVFPWALPSCIDLLPLIDAGISVSDIFARIRFDQGNGNYAYKFSDMFKSLFAADQPDNVFAAVATTDLDVNAYRLPLSKLNRSAHAFPFVEKYHNDWQKIYPYYTPFFGEALGFSVNLHEQKPKHFNDYEDQVTVLHRSPEIPGQAVVMREGSSLELTCPANYLTRDEWDHRICFPGLISPDDSRYDIIRRALALKQDLFANHTETEIRVGGGVKKGKATEKGMPETVYHDLRFGGGHQIPSKRWDFSSDSVLRQLMRVSV
jgi:hypothetical protein